MTYEEFKQMVDQMHKKGLNDDQIMQILYQTFMKKECDINDYALMVSWMGYKLTDEFYLAHGVKKPK